MEERLLRADAPSGGATPLRVLLVEDLPSDAELIALRLHEDGFAAACRRVETEAEFLAALEPPPDIILADWSLPRFSGLRALELLRERGLEIPFIIVSGSIGEELAIDALHLGADDYVLKDRLARLGTAIRRVLEHRRALAERRRAEDDLRLAAQVFESTAEGVLITDADHRIVKVNRAFTEITGYAAEDALGNTPRLLHSGLHSEAFYQRLRDALQRQGRWSGEIWNRRKDGSVYPEWLSISHVRDDQGRIGHYVGVFTDISSLRQAERRIEYLGRHDPLTDLPNRSLLEERLGQAFKLSAHGGGVALLVLNIDRMQRVNDSLGHEAGDEALRLLAERLRQQLSAGDTLARIGGDKFAMVLARCHSSSDATAVARRLLDAVAHPSIVRGQALTLTASVGIGLYPLDGGDPSELLRSADTALRHAKRSGGNRFSFYAPGMNAESVRWLDLENRLRRAIEGQALQLHYQPKVALADGRICGAEALLRWHDPDLGAVAPSDFIPLAEDVGLIVPLGEWAMHGACSQAVAWGRAGLPPLAVAVNVSAQQILDGRLPERVAAILAETGLPAQRLLLELTESVLLQESEATSRQIAEFARLGVRLSLDDFGTGYSSLSYLSRFPLHELKIDRGFVRDIGNQPKSAAIAEAIVALGHGLGMTVLAEGVETTAELAYLRRAGCDQMQGYLFSRALPASGFEALLREDRRLPVE